MVGRDFPGWVSLMETSDRRLSEERRVCSKVKCGGKAARGGGDGGVDKRVERKGACRGSGVDVQRN